MFADATMTEFIDLTHQSIEEIAVVTYYDEGSVEIQKGLLEHVLGLEVEMIGRLIQNQQVYRLQEKFENGKASTLTTGEDFHLLGRVFATKHESPEQIAYLVADFSFRHIVDSLEYGEFSIKQRGLILSEITYLYIMPQFEFSLILQLSHDTFHERGFTLAITTYESNLVATLYSKIHATEYLLIIKRH